MSKRLQIIDSYEFFRFYNEKQQRFVTYSVKILEIHKTVILDL